MLITYINKTIKFSKNVDKYIKRFMNFQVKLNSFSKVFFNRDKFSKNNTWRKYFSHATSFVSSQRFVGALSLEFSLVSLTKYMKKNTFIFKKLKIFSFASQLLSWDRVFVSNYFNFLCLAEGDIKVREKCLKSSENNQRQLTNHGYSLVDHVLVFFDHFPRHTARYYSIKVEFSFLCVPWNDKRIKAEREQNGVGTIRSCLRTTMNIIDVFSVKCIV